MIVFKKENLKRLNLAALKIEDLVVISALCQDSIIKVSNIKWAKKSRRFNLLLTRLCWEGNSSSKEKKTNFNRVNSILSFDSVLSVKTKGIDQSRSNLITSLLTLSYHSLSFDKQFIDLIFSGDAQITLHIECIDALLKDISEPFESSSLNLPNHENF